MRGKVASEKTLLIGTGITPAYAGKSLCLLRQKDDVWDHPRLCGEKEVFSMKCIVLTGSPPPMRGKDTLRTCDCAAIGITPAYAGKSLFCTCIQMCSEDHPRLCGEKSMVEAILCFLSGSPPPMRGKDQPAPRQPCLFRITPAYAGKSLTGTVWTRPPRDHPRLCGEKIMLARSYFFILGSPPPMRGKGVPHQNT